jgi:hypothetical protein
VIAALLLAAAPPNFPAATLLTIEQVRADPRRWDRQWVRLQGYVHRCSARDCVLSEALGNRGMLLSFAPASSFDAWIAPQLPAKVEVTARIDAGCLINICIGRAPVLQQVYVETMVANIPDEDR